MIYQKKFSSDPLWAYPLVGAGLDPLMVLYQDRFVRIDTNLYRLVSSLDRGTVYVIPDRLMSEVM